MYAIPEVPHVKCVGDTLYRRPHWAQPISGVADFAQDPVDEVHRVGGEFVAHGIFGGIREDLLRRRAVQVDGGDGIVFGCARVKGLEALDCH